MNQSRKENKSKTSSLPPQQQQQQQGEEQENQLMSSISTSLHNFKIKMSLGRGAGSYVFLIEEYKSNQLYALKTITKQSQYYMNNIHRITNEYNLHSQLDHDNIVKVLRRFEDVEYVYMMLEYCPGGSLFDYVKSKGRLSEEETMNISYQIVLGLEYLHQNKIIHRDLKPGNILLTGNNNVKICDFGLAVRLLDYDSERDTFCGTPNYIAPEICSREPYGMKSDCWSFGCILYTIATGRPPFETHSIQQTLKMLQKKNNVVYPTHLSKTLVDLIEHILDWNSESRYTISEIKNHEFFNKVRGQSGQNQYKQNVKSITAQIQQQYQQQNQLQQQQQLLQQQKQQIQHSNSNKNSTATQQQQLLQPQNRQRSNYSMDYLNNNNNKNVALHKINDISSSKQNIINSINNVNPINNVNKENIHQNMLNYQTLMNENKYLKNKSNSNSTNPIPLQKSYSLYSQQQNQIATPSTAVTPSSKEISEQLLLNRNKSNDYQNLSSKSQSFQQQQQQQQQQNNNQNPGYNPCINNTPNQIQQKPQSKTILNTFLNKEQKSNSLHQSSSTTPYSNNNTNNNNSQQSNNFFQSQKSYRNPIAQILNDNPQQQQISSNHQKNKSSFDINSLLPPSTPKTIDINKNKNNNEIQDITNKYRNQQPRQNTSGEQKSPLPTQQIRTNSLSHSSNNHTSLKDHIHSKMLNNSNSIQTTNLDHNINNNPFLSASSNNNSNTSKSNPNNNHLINSNKNNIQNIKFPPQQQSISSSSQSNINRLNQSSYNTLKQSSSSSFNNNTNNLNYSSNNIKKSSSIQNNHNNSNKHVQQNSFDLSSLKLDYQQMNNFSIERELQGTAQFSSKSNSLQTPLNNQVRSRPPSVKNSQTQRNTITPSFAPNQSQLRAKGTSNEYIRTEPCQNEINETPRLECLETEHNGDTSTAACSKYSMSTTNRSFNKGLNTSKSFTSFMGGENTASSAVNTTNITNFNDQSTTTILQSSSIPPPHLISPVKVGQDLDISKIKTKNGFIEITPDRSLLVESCNGRLLFKISQDGKKINKLIDKQIEKHYTLENLPQKYYALYGYAKQVVNALKTKKVITKLENKEGIFTLLEDDCFEAQFKTGHKIYYKKKTAWMRIKSFADNQTYEISLEKNSKDFPDDIKIITTKSIKYYEYLQNQMKEFSNI